MFSKAELRKNKVAVAILMFICVYALFYMVKPGFAYVMDRKSSIDIDEEVDFLVADYLLKSINR